MKKLYLILSSFLLFIFIFSSSKAQTFYGYAVVVDADTIKIGNYKIRLFGIDAPEKKQFCEKPYLNLIIFSFNERYPCGKVSTDALKEFVKEKIISCEIEEKKDFYKRYLGTCFKNKENINSWLVKNGYAVAYKKYSKKYLLDEQYAKKNKLGLWKGTFVRPEKWRRISK
tara:strand:- start:5863 stop:6372 length:510 start_codon:yes stop_codon:yes gene_type:complete